MQHIPFIYCPIKVIYHITTSQPPVHRTAQKYIEAYSLIYMQRNAAPFANALPYLLSSPNTNI
jgi:hypothetical protein